jgi:uncharacterized protein DUF6010
MLLPIVVGAVLGGLFVLFAARKGSRAEARLLAAGLVVAALIYLVLALARNGGDWLAIEVGGVALFGALAWQGMRGSPWFLVVGWLGHVAWDVGLHLDRAPPIAPEWYPLLCVGFDLIVAGFVAGRISPALELRHRDSRNP